MFLFPFMTGPNRPPKVLVACAMVLFNCAPWGAAVVRLDYAIICTYDDDILN